MLLMLASAIVLSVNGMTIGSPIIGIVGSMAYLIVGGYMIKGIFGGKHTVVSLSFGALLLMILLGVIGWIFAISYKLGAIEVSLSLFLVLFLTLLIQKFTSDRHSTVETKDDSVSVYVRCIEITFVALTCLQIIFLLQSRTSLPISVWITMNPWVMVTFFFNTALLIALMFTTEKWQIKMLLVVGHSILSHMFFVLVFDVGYGWDQWGTFGWTRRVFDVSSYPQNVIFSLHSPFSLLLKLYRIFNGVFQPALSTILSRMFSVDVFWGHLLLVPLLWGIFIPIIAYRITEIATEKRKLALFSGLLTLAAPSLILWGAVSVSNSLGYVLFFFVTYLLVDYLASDRKILWAALGVFACLLTHLLVGIMASSLFLLAYGLKRYQDVKPKKIRKIFLLVVFLVSVGLLPFSLSLGWLAYPARVGATFSLEPLQDLSTYDAVMMFLIGAYGDFTLKDAIVYGLLPLLGLLGLIYVNTSRKFVHNRRVSFFLLLTFILISLDYQMAKSFMLNLGFGKERLWLFRDLISIPFASVLIFKVMGILNNLIPKSIASRNISLKGFSSTNFGGIASKAITVLFVSALITGSVYIGYPLTKHPRWLTAHELEAAKYIDSTTNEPYVVVCYKFFKIAGYTVVGTENPVAYYSRQYDYGWMERFFDRVSKGSADAMIEAAKVNNASIAFFVISSFRSIDADSVIGLLSERPDFELYGIFGDDVYIFRYIVPRERVEEGIGPSVYIYSHQEYVNTTFVVDLVTFEAVYMVSLNGSNNYDLTNWPTHWSFEKISPEPGIKSIDGNLWINFTGEETVVYMVLWRANLLYQTVGWKDDSFMAGWTRSNAGGFTEKPLTETDGDVLTMTGNFQSGVREFDWRWKPLNVSTDLYRYVLVRWRSTSTCAIAWAYYTDGSHQRILTYGSYSDDWTTTMVSLSEGKIIEHIMVGLDDFRADIAGSHSAYFDFIMLANRTAPGV